MKKKRSEKNKQQTNVSVVNNNNDKTKLVDLHMCSYIVIGKKEKTRVE
jgi:hypothetical protein